MWTVSMQDVASAIYKDVKTADAYLSCTGTWKSASNPPKISTDKSDFLLLKLNNNHVVPGYYSGVDNGYILFHILDTCNNLRYVKEWRFQ